MSVADDIPIQVRCCSDPGKILGYIHCSPEQWRSWRTHAELSFDIGRDLRHSGYSFDDDPDALVETDLRILRLPLRRFCVGVSALDDATVLTAWYALDSHGATLDELRRIRSWEDAREDFEYLMPDRSVRTLTREARERYAAEYGDQ